MSKLMTRTAYGTALQIASLHGIPHEVLEYTTLNEKHEINTDVNIASDERHTIQYYGIGNGGHYHGTAGGIPTNLNYSHRYRDPTFFNQIPFVVREIDNDLTPTQRERYRLRRRQNIHGTDYWVYWLKPLDPIVGSVVLEVTDTNIEGSDPEEYVPTLDDMSPIPPTVNSEGVIVSSSLTLSTKLYRTLSLTAWEGEEVLNACEIIHGTRSAAMISEIGIVSGIERSMPITLFDNATTTMTEALQTQVNHFLRSTEQLSDTKNTLALEFDSGASEPLLE